MVEDTDKLAEELARHMPLMTAADCCDRNASQFGNRPAIKDRRRELTWAEVSDCSDRLARRLLDLGLERDAPVLVQLPNSCELFLTRLACEKAGVRLVTVAPGLRRAELQSIVKLTSPEVVILAARYRDFDHYGLFKELRISGLKHVLAAWEEVPRGALSLEEILTRKITQEGVESLRKTRYTVVDICQLATTSGSTGTPKCAAVPLYTRLLTSWIHLHRFQVTQDDTLGAVTPIISGVADGLVYNGGCQVGARVVLMDHFDPDGVCAAVSSERINVLPLVPTMIARILAATDLTRYDLSFLRMVVSHGSLLPYLLGAAAEERLGCRIMQGYGSVDCGGVCATSWENPPEVRLKTVGRPLPGNTLRLVDREGKDVEPGAVGRLWIRGLASNARFFNNRELESRRRPGEFLDLEEYGRLDEDGNLTLVGREQELIIRGGQNIFPADIEEMLLQHPSVAEASVVGIPDSEMGERVCAYVVCRRGRVLSLDEAKAFLRERGLAHFKWPDMLVILDELPRVLSGEKVDKRALKRRAVSGKG